jgi:hypothetical protein
MGLSVACTETLHTGNELSSAGGASNASNVGSNGGTLNASAPEILPGSGTEDFWLGCPPGDGGKLDRACVFDSNGKKYAPDAKQGLSNVPYFGVALHFAPAYAPQPADVTTDGPNSAIQAFANTDGRPEWGATPDRIRVQTHWIDNNLGLIVAVVDPVPNSYYITIGLDYAVMYRSRLSPNCNASEPELGQFCGGVRGGPSFQFRVVAPQQAETNPTANGTCLLSYNKALLPESADPCCLRKGGANECNAITRCNDLAAPGCCLVYGTESTANGTRCCLYEGGELGDGAEECQQLLQSGS